MHLFAPKGGSRTLIFDKWQLEIKENYNVYRDLRGNKIFLAKRIRAHDGCLGIRRL